VLSGRICRTNGIRQPLTKLAVDGTNPLPPGTAAPITLHIRRHGKIFS
jgi:hypothetical protein